MVSIVLKNTDASDYDDYYRIRCSPSDIYWNGYNSKPNYANFKQLFINRTTDTPFEKTEDRHIYLIQLLREECQNSIGFIQLIHRGTYIEIGYTVIEEFQGRGYATEALKQAVPLALQYRDTVIVRIRDDNIASQKVAYKCSFIRTEEFIEKEYPNCGIVKLRTYCYKSDDK